MKKNLLASLSLLTAATFIFATPAVGQITLGSVDDFTAVSEAGWSEGGNTPNAPIHNSGVGADGLAGHLQNVSDGAGSGGRWLMFNDAQWTGDYLTAGVTGFQLDFDNRSGNGVDANLRIALNGAGGWFLSDDILVADGSGWQTFGFDLLSLNHLTGGSNSLTDTLSDVTRFEILSSVSDTPSVGGAGVVRGDNLVADFRVDNLRAVPEPTTFALVVMAAMGLAVRRRK